MTDTPERELIESIDVAERGLVVATVASCNCDHPANISPQPEAHTLECRYRVLAVAAHALADARHTIEALLSRVDKLEERVSLLEDEIVDLWHESGEGTKELHECLGMTAEEYARWVNPDALNRSAS